MLVQEVQLLNYTTQSSPKDAVVNTKEDNASIYDDLNSYPYYSSENTFFKNFLQNTEYDADNDGKIDFKAGLKCFGSGILDNLKEKANQVIYFAKKHPVLAAGAAVITIGAGVALGAGLPALVASAAINMTTAGAILSGLGLIGFGFGLYKAVPAFKEGWNSYQDFKNSDNIMESLKALHDIGSSSVDTAEGVILAAMGVKTVVDGVGMIACESEVGLLSNFKPKLVSNAEKSLHNASNAVYTNDPTGAQQYMAESHAYNYLTGCKNEILSKGNIDGGILGGLIGADIYTNDITDITYY